MSESIVVGMFINKNDMLSKNFNKNSSDHMWVDRHEPHVKKNSLQRRSAPILPKIYELIMCDSDHIFPI